MIQISRQVLIPFVLLFALFGVYLTSMSVFDLYLMIGIAVLAIEHEVPIIPVYIDRAFELLPKGRRFVKPGALTVRFGEPIAAPDLSEHGERAEVARDLAERVEAAVIAMSGETAK